MRYIKGFQQKTGALMTTNRIMQSIRKGDLTAEESKSLFLDFGFEEHHIAAMKRLIDNGTVTFDADGIVTRLNGDQWPIELNEVFSSGVVRNVDRLVQKSLAGETDPWMHTDMGALLTHLKTFPMLASQKQFLHATKVGGARSVALLGYGVGMAALVSYSRAAAEGKDMTNMEHIVRAVSYSNATGFIPMYFDPVAMMTGMDHLRFNRYGNTGDVLASPAAFSWANDALRIPGATIKAAAGDADYQDKKAFRAAPLMNTMIIGDWLTSLGQKDK